MILGTGYGNTAIIYPYRLWLSKGLACGTCANKPFCALDLGFSIW
jgi:hypothetical protein